MYLSTIKDLLNVWEFGQDTQPEYAARVAIERLRPARMAARLLESEGDLLCLEVTLGSAPGPEGRLLRGAARPVQDREPEGRAAAGPASDLRPALQAPHCSNLSRTVAELARVLAERLQQVEIYGGGKCDCGNAEARAFLAKLRGLLAAIDQGQLG